MTRISQASLTGQNANRVILSLQAAPDPRQPRSERVFPLGADSEAGKRRQLLLASACLAALAVGFALTPQAALAATVTWTNGAGDNNFNSPTNWNTGIVPVAGDDVVIGAGFTVNVPSGHTINSLTTATGTVVNDNSNLTINAGTNAGANAGTLNANNNTSLTLTGGFNNTGSVALNSLGNNTDLQVSGTLSLTGGGAVTLSNNTANRVYGLGGGSVLDNVNNTISGGGEIGVNGNLFVTNEAAGVIDANQTSALTLDSGNTITNKGILRATNTGGLRFVAGAVDNTGGGRIQANGAGAHVDLLNSVIIKGGTLSTSAGGVIQSTNVATLDGTGSAILITSGSTVQLPNNTQLDLLGTITNHGTIALNSAGNITDLVIGGGGTVTLNGGGQVRLSDNTANRIYASPASTLDNVNNTISGAGEIGVNGNLTLKNESAIDANAINALTIDASVPVQNTGILRSTNTTGGNGGLVLSSTIIDNTGAGNSGLITAIGANTHVDLMNSTIRGGSITTSGGGVVQTFGNSTLDGTVGTVTVTSGSTMRVNNNTALNLVGTVNAQGVILLNSAGNLTDLVIGAGTITLTGPGGITTSDNSQNRIYGNTPGGVLDNVNSVISGAGAIGINGNLTLKNESLIDANLTTALTINSPNAVLNTGTLRSSNTSAGNGGLVLAGTKIDNTGASNSGLILATGTNAHVDIVNSTILGGTLTGTGGGVFNGNASTLDGTTAGAPVNITAGTTLNYGNNTANTLNGTINNKGTIAQNSAGNLTDLIIGAAGAKLTGGGAITLSDNSQNRIYSNTAGAVLENVNNIISGAGQFFQNAGMVLKNDTAGVIDATGANALSINTFPGTNPVQNLGLLETTAGAGGLTIGTGATIDNTGNSNAGRIVADGAGTHVDIVSSTILGGTLTGKNGGVLNGSSSTLDGSTAGAPVNIVAGTKLSYGNNTTNTLVGTIHNDGTIAQNSAGNVTDLLIGAGGVTLTGSGALVLSDNSANRIYANNAGTVLTNVSNTISGAGQIFTNAGLSLVNSGTVDATGANALTMGLDITNNPGGTLRGSGAGGLMINAGTTNNQGIVEALNASAVTFNGSAAVANNAGGTLTGGIWRSISTGTGAAITLTGGTIQTNAADIYLAGTGSTLIAGGSSIDTTLATNNGALRIQDGRKFTATGGGGNFVNNGLLELANPTGGSQFQAATSLTNSATGTITGYGTVANRVANAGTVNAILGNLAVTGGVTGAGTVSAQTGATVDFSSATAASTAGNLLLAAGGKLALGSQNITVSQDYNNANFGTGNSFNNHANVTGTGQILASGTGLSLSVSGTGITGGGTPTPTLGLGNVHVGSPLGGAFDINWAGTGAPSLRGAVQNTAGLSVSAPGFGPIAPGGSAHETVSVVAGAAGSLSGQSLKVVSNFDNVAAQTIAVTGAAYDLANPTILTVQPIAFGSHHVGDAIVQQGVAIRNTVVTNAAFQEGLNAGVSSTTAGVTTNGGSFNLLAAGSSSSAIAVGIDTASAGNKGGSATIALTSDGAGTSGLGKTGLASQNFAVTGAVFNLASSSTIAPINLGVRHVGDGSGSVAVGIGVTNTAPAGLFSEGLNSGFGSYTNSGGTLNPTFSGSITNLAAGATDSASLQAMLSTLVAGSVSGNVTIHQASNGTISGLANTALADQTPSVTGSVSATITNLAQPVINNAQPISFGNVRIGTATTAQTVSVTNGAPVGPFTEGLIGNVAGTTGTGILASGGFGAAGNSLAPGATNPPNPPASGHISVNIDTSSGGAKSGNALIDFKSDGTAFGGIVTDLGNTPVAVAGNVYRLANPVQNTSAVSLAARVGDAAPNAGVSLTNASPDVFTEGLKAGFGTLSAGFTGTGAIANLAAGGTDASTLKIGLSTAVSGSFAGSAGLAFTSTGAGTDGAPDLALTGGSVTLSGKVYQTAVASVTPNPVSFGIVHVGDVVAAKSINVANTATGALVDVITGGFGTVGSPFTGSGTLGAGVASGGNSNALQVGLSTVAAGVFSGTANLALASHDAALADVSLATSVALSGQVNNFAKPAYGKLSGAGSFSGAALAYKLDFGTVLQGSAMQLSYLEVLNAVLAPADDLSGSFTQSGTGLSEFSFTGLTPFTGLAAGGADPFSSDFNPTTNGFFDVFVTLNPIGSNASGFSGALPSVTLEFTGTVQSSVVPTPEPAGIALFATALLGLLGIRRRNCRA